MKTPELRHEKKTWEQHPPSITGAELGNTEGAEPAQGRPPCVEGLHVSPD